MGGKSKNRNAVPGEEHLLLPGHPNVATPIIDTHTHLLSTFSSYASKYKGGKHKDVFEFVRAMYAGRNVKAIVDVWCEAPVQAAWKELADSALSAQDREHKWGGIDYWFVMGVHPHEAKLYSDEVEASILEAMAHPRCVGWGEIGLDYHYDNSPRDLQQAVLIRQLQQAVQLGKPLTIHTREAEEDTERILKQVVPVDHKIHIHCFTDSPDFAQRLLDHFPNLHIGVTGVVTYSTNLNTSAIIKQMAAAPEGPRILLETDAPFMVPSNLYSSLQGVKGRLPLCHTAMIPWVADFAANVAGEGWDTEKIMLRANESAQTVYGI
ncbi:Metallo-dependent hydrolase [Leucogyrophana mollusca]|uniref:Metallo-dependent hydrolase n=1 Tax=Leucogyrophana mollusca TaxID=85980 RepID=A0ACB8BKL4_9AGAM|nr:Metallo-dependent hydrolase [Leucogyrophana mollusca]